MTHGSEPDVVREVLRNAFADVPNRGFSDESELSHRDCVRLRLELALLGPDDVQRILPRILEDLLDSHTDDPIVTEGAEYVLMQLNADMWISDARKRDYEEIWGAEGVAVDEEMRSVKRVMAAKTFEHFTAEQANAILEWLLTAQDWKDFRDWSDELEGAIAYWRRRATQS